MVLRAQNGLVFDGSHEYEYVMNFEYASKKYKVNPYKSMSYQ